MSVCLPAKPDVMEHTGVLCIAMMESARFSRKTSTVARIGDKHEYGCVIVSFTMTQTFRSPRLWSLVIGFDRGEHGVLAYRTLYGMLVLAHLIPDICITYGFGSFCRCVVN